MCKFCLALPPSTNGGLDGGDDLGSDSDRTPLTQDTVIQIDSGEDKGRKAGKVKEAVIFNFMF